MAKTGKPKDRPAAEGQGGGAARAALGPPRSVRLALSGAVVWHLAVVFLSPLAVQPASIVVTEIATSPWVRWYTDSLYLNQGYHFFGPDPPRNQLMRYRVTDAAGAVVAEGSFPDKGAQRPRLLYHRHMMLADQAANGPPDVAPEEWLRLTMRSYARHLLRRHGGDRATIECVVHNPLTPRQTLSEVDENGPETFVSVTWVEETAATVADPLPIPAAPVAPTPDPPTPAAEPVPVGDSP